MGVGLVDDVTLVKLTCVKELVAKFELAIEQIARQRHIHLRVEDSGEGFDYENYRPPEEDSIALNGRRLMLIESLCESLCYEGRGNIAKATFTWATQ